MANIDINVLTNDRLIPVAVPLVTSGIIQDVNINDRYITLTTGGSGGPELLNIPNPVLDGNGFNVAWLGMTVNLYLPALTDPGDSVVISIDVAGLTIPLFGSYVDGIPLISTSGGVKLTYAGAAVSFKWIGGNWTYDMNATGGDDGSTIVGPAGTFTTVDAKTVTVKNALVKSIV